ncbi:MAG TPA: hypothetical protein VMT89_01865, partial [Candidatus Acidoferrales bacterium]|nr:hypothetical protein [Candidatus Acidoferrales bacterium]
MKLWGRVLGVLLLLAAVSAARADDAMLEAPPASDVDLLNNVPSIDEVLRHQWTDALPQDAVDAEQSTEKYGRLLNAPLQATTLGECIALALKNNTDLQVGRLGPVSAAAAVRKAYSVFDPTLFGNVSRDRTVNPATTAFLTGGSLISFNQ